MLLGPTILYKMNGEPKAQVGDRMVQVLPLEAPLTKQGVERAQADHFQRQVAGHSEWSFEIEHARDRPDFWIRRGDHRLGLDVAAFAGTERRRAADQFRKLKLILMAAYRRGRLRQCEGIEVQLFFSTERLLRPEQFERSSVRLIESLERYRVDHAAWARTNGSEFVAGGPKPFPMGESGSSHDGSMNWHVSGLTQGYSVFFNTCGFNIEHQYTEIARPDIVRANVDRIIAAHDVAGQMIDELVLVAAGPDVFGEAMSGESVIPNLFFDQWQGSISPPSNLTRIFVDNWLLGGPRLLFDRKIGFLINT